MPEMNLEQIWKETEQKYMASSPLTIAACALYRDESASRSIAQIKWKNETDQTIDSVVVKLTFYNKSGYVCEEIEYFYEDLAALPGRYFGDKRGIIVPKTEPEYFEVALLEVQYTDGNIWEGDESQVFVTQSSQIEENYDYNENYDREEKGNDQRIVDIPKSKYLIGLLILFFIAYAACDLITITTREREFRVVNIVRWVINAIPLILLLVNERKKKRIAKCGAIIIIVLDIGLSVYSVVAGRFSISISSLASELLLLLLAIFILVGEEKQESKLWFILCCVLGCLVLLFTFTNNNGDTMIEKVTTRIVEIVKFAFYLVSFSPNNWFASYGIKERTLRTVQLGRLFAFITGMVAIIFQIIGSSGVSTPNFNREMLLYQITGYMDFARRAALTKPLDIYYRYNTISMVNACVATLLFLSTLIIVHIKKRGITEW